MDTYYLKRAFVAQLSLGANLPKQTKFPRHLGDRAGKATQTATKGPSCRGRVVPVAERPIRNLRVA